MTPVGTAPGIATFILACAEADAAKGSGDAAKVRALVERYLALDRYDDPLPTTLARLNEYDRFVLPLLAARYSDRPGYRAREWRLDADLPGGAS